MKAFHLLLLILLLPLSCNLNNNGNSIPIPDARRGIVLASSGKVEKVVNENRNRTLFAGDYLSKGGRLKCGSNSNMTLWLPGELILVIEENSEIDWKLVDRPGAYPWVEVELITGSIAACLAYRESEFEVRLISGNFVQILGTEPLLLFRSEIDGSEELLKDISFEETRPNLLSYILLWQKKISETFSSLQRSSITSFPGDANISVLDYGVGSGHWLYALPFGFGDVEVGCSRPGYYSSIETISIPTVTDSLYEFRFSLKEKEAVSFEINLEPAETRILLNGIFVGMGRLVGQVQRGETVELRFLLDGYNEKRVLLDWEQDFDSIMNITLDKTIDSTFKFLTTEISGIVNYQTTYHNIYILCEKNGRVSGTTDTGIPLWSKYTNNRASSVSYPLISDDQLFFTGRSVLMVMSPLNGDDNNIRYLTAEEKHLYGRRMQSWNNGVVYPATDSIKFLTTSSGNVYHTIPIPGGSLMTPMITENSIYTVAQDGNIYRFTTTGELIAREKSDAVRPNSLSIVNDGLFGYFADVNGMVIKFTLDKLDIVWQKAISDEKSAVYNDILIYKDTLFVYSQGELHLIDKENGNISGDSIKGFITPPTLLGSMIYGATVDGRFSVFSAETTEKIFEVDVAGGVSTPIFQYDGKLVLGCRNGRVYIFNPQDESISPSSYQF